MWGQQALVLGGLAVRVAARLAARVQRVSLARLFELPRCLGGCCRGRRLAGRGAGRLSGRAPAALAAGIRPLGPARLLEPPLGFGGGTTLLAVGSGVALARARG